MTDQFDNTSPLPSAEELAEKLNDKQIAFVEAYLRLWNATAAAKEAAYSHPGQQGERLLKKVEIADYIKARLREASLSADEVLMRLSEQARVNIADFVREGTEPVYDKDGNLLGERQVVEIDWNAVKKRGHLIRSTTNTRAGPKLELHDAQSALITIGKAHKLFVDREIPVNVNLNVTADELAQARAKAQQHEASLLADEG